MLVLAHRGLHDRKISENTLLAFQRALSVNVEGIEFDLRVSRDKEIVIVHDENLSRIAGDSRRVRDLTAAELADVALRGEGSIPTLNDVTASIPGPTLLDMEVKDSDALPLLIAKLRTSAGLRERTIVSSFVIEDLEAIHETVPEVRTLFLLSNWPVLFRGAALWRRVRDTKPWGVGVRFSMLSQRRVRFLRKQGWKVAAWDDRRSKRDARKIARLGVDIAIVYCPEACK